MHSKVNFKERKARHRPSAMARHSRPPAPVTHLCLRRSSLISAAYIPHGRVRTPMNPVELRHVLVSCMEAGEGGSGCCCCSGGSGCGCGGGGCSGSDDRAVRAGGERPAVKASMVRTQSASSTVATSSSAAAPSSSSSSSAAASGYNTSNRGIRGLAK